MNTFMESILEALASLNKYGAAISIATTIVGVATALFQYGSRVNRGEATRSAASSTPREIRHHENRVGFDLKKWCETRTRREQDLLFIPLFSGFPFSALVCLRVAFLFDPTLFEGHSNLTLIIVAVVAFASFLGVFVFSCLAAMGMLIMPFVVLAMICREIGAWLQDISFRSTALHLGLIVHVCVFGYAIFPISIWCVRTADALLSP